ncbi:hypothetical protein [Paenibacillus lactis]|uniref:Uncharacterized protein n=2 Tax=Paenibacillus lactis TaxID=228574 RepID=G4HDF2_9BACL|nr:hypothetical protein [Paenibacillus lactis]EHB66078.1 hypothetical protein PaelaDRAFT_2005 [Paenibacillus lactis 154]MBP1891464.1 hypothetical protein [Paenibacillus lactis]GIO93488.1 hypothetical protein J31TS3_47150 [Paenibacillus lactis]HAF98170.1 hypothetical protein [Paenibacillus lactis]
MFESKVVPILERLSTTEKKMLISSLKSLDFEDDMKYNSFGHKFREMMTKVLHRLAPDKDVLACSWYENEHDNKPTRKQRLLYAIKSGLEDEFIESELEIDLAIVSKRLGKVVSELNKYTHFGEGAIDVSKEIGEAFVSESIDFLLQFFSNIDEIRSQIVNAYEDLLNRKITEAIINDVLQEIDVLATHYTVDGNTIDTISVTDIDAHYIYIYIDGFVDVTHQFGSDGDLRRGDGVEFEESYPFTINMEVPVFDPLDIEIETDDIMVDTDKYYDDGEEEIDPGDEPYEPDEPDYDDER